MAGEGCAFIAACVRLCVQYDQSIPILPIACDMGILHILWYRLSNPNSNFNTNPNHNINKPGLGCFAECRMWKFVKG